MARHAIVLVHSLVLDLASWRPALDHETFPVRSLLFVRATGLNLMRRIQEPRSPGRGLWRAVLRMAFCVGFDERIGALGRCLAPTWRT